MPGGRSSSAGPCCTGVGDGPVRARGAAPGPGAQALPNIKVKLEAETTTYHHLLGEGEDFDLGDSLDNSHTTQSTQKPATHRTVDGEVGSEVPDTNVQGH